MEVLDFYGLGESQLKRGESMKRIKKNPSIFYIGVGVFIIFILGYYFYMRSHNSYDSLKVDSSQPFVYTISEDQKGYYFQYKPYVNLKGELGDYCNQDIESFFQAFNQNNISITYESSLNGKILSIIMKVGNYGYAESAVIYQFRSYHINLDTLEILDNDKVLSYFNLTSTQVQEIMDQKLKEFYEELVESKEINGRTCNYQCFLKGKQITSDLEDVEYFIRDAKLYAYKPYVHISQNDLSLHEFEITV